MRRRSSTALALLFLFFWGGTVAGQEPETKTSEAKEITGRVVSDSGQPLAGAIISAGRSATSTSQRTSSDNEGNFRIQALDSGLYRVFASMPGYVSQIGQTDVGIPNSFYRPGDSISLTLVKGGVISGIITNISGEPVVNINVRALRVKDADGEKVQGPSPFSNRMTDDRGYYRLYGLQPGTYIVAAGGPAQFPGGINPFAHDAPTFAPASTRDTAAEFIVRPDQEVTADIRYRGDTGHAVSGRVTGAVPVPSVPGAGASVRIMDGETRATLAAVPAQGEERTFQINGVSDGDYEISALGVAGGPGSDMNASPSRRISVKGADVTGIELTLAPLASIAGRVNLELDEKLKCGRRRDNALRETMIFVRRERPEEKSPAPKSSDTAGDAPGLLQTSLDNIPNDKGEITFRNLGPATYRFEIRLPGAGWYVKDLSLPSSDARNKQPAPNIPKNGIAIKTGDRIAGLSITIVEGGAGFRGRVTAGEGQSVPAGLRVYLVPAERESVDNMFRFFEGPVDSDGQFAIGNIAPGKYWLVAQPQEGAAGKAPRSIRTDSAMRARILRGAEASKKEIIFKPCDRTLDYELSLTPASKGLD